VHGNAADMYSNQVSTLPEDPSIQRISFLSEGMRPVSNNGMNKAGVPGNTTQLHITSLS
jgi:hypothetical protein